MRRRRVDPAEEARREQAKRDVWNLAITMRIARYELAGGPTREDVARVLALEPVLAERSEFLLYKGGEPGETADLFNRTADAVAVLACVVTNGVDFMGVRYRGCEFTPPQEDAQG